MYINKQVTNMRESLMKDLSQNICVVVFRKKDGSLRPMTCTRHPFWTDGLDETPKEKHRVSEDVVPVYDVDKKAWRSFRIDSIEFYAHKW